MQIKFHGLDAVRGLLALAVCFSHAFTVLVRPYAASKGLVHYAWVLSARTAVVGFFVLSGFVIAYSIERNLRRNEQFNWADYASARVARILPPLVIAMIFTVALAGVLAALGLQDLPVGTPSERSSFRVDYGSQLQSLFTLGLRGDLSGGLNGPLWSLAYEIQLYTIMGLAAAALFGKHRLWVAFAFLLFVVALAITADLLQLLCFAAFLSGAAANAIRHRQFDAATLVRSMVGLLLASVATMIGADIDNLDRTALALASQLFLALSISIALLLIVRINAPVWLTHLGTCSYTLYIIHFPLLLFVYFLLQPLQQPWLVCLAGVALAIVISVSIAPWAENVPNWRRMLRLNFA